MRTLGINTSSIPPTTSAFSNSSSRSPWHSPVSYMFGGLAAMTGLIAFALLVLACSYCHLSTTHEEDDERRRRHGDVEEGKTGEDDVSKVSPVFEDKFLVIMAGHHIPTFLATPMVTKASDVAAESSVVEVAGDGERSLKEGEEEREVDREETSSNVVNSNS